MIRSIAYFTHLFVFLWLLLGWVNTAQASPNLWWDHINWGRGKDQPACVRQASSLVLKDATHHVTVDTDSVRLWSEQTVAVVECIHFGEELVTAILVSGTNSEEGSRLFSHLQDGMRQTP
jgi:hypothetical protein